MLIATDAAPAARLLDHIAKCLDPVATLYAGYSAAVVRAAVHQAWIDHTGRELPEPLLSRCVAAISSGQTWRSAFWVCG